MNTALENEHLAPWQLRIQETKKKKNQLNKRQDEDRKRYDEQYALDHLLQWCKLNSIVLLPIDSRLIELGNKDPDYAFLYNNELLIVEVRQLGTGFVEYQGELIDRARDNHQLFVLGERLSNLIVLWADKRQTIILTALCTIEELNKRVARLHELFRKRFQGNVDTESVEFEGVPVLARSTSFYKDMDEYSPLKIIPALVCSDRVIQYNSLKGEAISILSYAIKNKEKKYHTLNERKWLVLINTHPLLQVNDYLDAYNSLLLRGKIHSFEKVFIL